MQPAPAKHKREPRLDLNPSSADRWTTCTASPRFLLENWDRLPDTSTAFSQEGTTAHEVASAYLQNRKPNTDSSYFCPVPVNAEMRWHGWNYAEYVNSLREPGGILLVEQKLPLWYMPGRNAIVDAAVVNPGGLHVVDYKYGEGVTVSPFQSLQASIYAVCVVKAQGLALISNDFPITVHIYQPRGRNSADSPVSIWETNWKEIHDIANRILNQADTVQHYPAFQVFAPSEKACQWCPAKGFCTERAKTLTEGIEALAVIDDKPKTLPAAGVLTPEQIAAVLKHKSQIAKWLNEVEAYAHQMLSRGERVPGYKLVMGRAGHRYWSNEREAKKLLLENTVLRRDEVIEEKVISPAAVEKLLGKNRMNAGLMNLIARPNGCPVIAPEEDKRESCEVRAETEFQAIEDF